MIPALQGARPPGSRPRWTSLLGLPAVIWLSGLAWAAPADGTPAPVALHSPSRGTVLQAGSSARLSWEPPAGGLAPEVEEWEAFLSFDGGVTYPLRLTPHLGAGVTSFWFRVPAVPTRDARLVLRFGDERREVGWEAPVRFAIEVPSGYLPSPRATVPSAVPGEPARPADNGVTAWLEGERDGSGLRWREAPGGPGASPAEVLPGWRHSDPAEEAEGLAATNAAGWRSGERITAAPDRLPPPSRPRPSGADLLHRIQRLNP